MPGVQSEDFSVNVTPGQRPREDEGGAADAGGEVSQAQ